MKQITFIAIIAIAIIFQSCGNNEEKSNTDSNDTLTTENKSEKVETVPNSGKIAFIDVDSLLINYEFYKELEKQITTKYTNAEKEFNRKSKQFENEVNEFKRKEASNGFLSQESYQMQAQQLMQKEQDLQALNIQLTQDIEQERIKLNKEMNDTVFNFIKEWNKEANYDYVLNKSFFIYGKEINNITDTIITLLNSKYRKENPKEEE